jgi:nicotinate-nucleotide adenylyltransferase
VRLAVLGGTFDPPHIGHLLVASDVYDALALDRLIFVPAAQQPLKTDRATAPAAHRLAMVRLMVGDDSRFDVDPIETERPGLSYSVDTLTHFASRHETDERFFVVGTDVLATFAKWRQPEEVLRLARLAVVGRLHEGRDDRESGGWRDVEAVQAMARNVGAPEPVLLETRRIDVSSTEIRERIRTCTPIHGFVTEAVAEYLDRYRLYR